MFRGLSELFGLQHSCSSGCDDSIFASTRTWAQQDICSNNNTCSSLNCVGSYSHQVFNIVDHTRQRSYN